MDIHPCHYEPITIAILKNFISGFPSISDPSEVALHEEKGEIVFGTFNVLLSDILIADIPSFINYVPTGRKIEKDSTVMRRHLAVLVRTLTKRVCFGKALQVGGLIAEPLLTIEENYNSPLTKNGWNCLFLIETENNTEDFLLSKHEKDGQTYLTFIDSPDHVEMLHN